MSYCRWSSNDFKSDLYCYADVAGGYTTHVASQRYPEGGPPCPKITDMLTDLAKYQAERDVWDKWSDGVEMVEIGLPFDGQTFRDGTLEAFRDRVQMLADAGYNVPEWLVPDIEEEMIEETHNRSKALSQEETK